MKTLLMSLILSTSLLSNATSVDMTKVLAEVNGREKGIVAIALLEDRRLQVVNSKGVVTTTFVSEAAFDRLAGEVSTLTNVEVVEVNRTAVCKMIVIPFLSDLSVAGYDQEANEYTYGRKLILTNQSCALSYEVYPKHQAHLARAISLREKLVILALNTLK